MAAARRRTAPPSADLKVLANWAPELADTFVALSCDIALVIDGGGLIQRMAQHDARPIAPAGWLGLPWVQTAGTDSREKVVQMLADVATAGHATRREINHLEAIGGPVPVAYSAVRLGPAGPTLAIGHDLREQAVLQQRFVAAQEALERSYWAVQRETRDAARGLVSSGLPALRMTDGERASLGLATAAEQAQALADSELAVALGRLVERIGRDELPGLLRDVRRVAERHFLARALQRAGSLDALARSLGTSRRALVRRRRP